MNERSQLRALAGIALVAFALRVAARLQSGAEAFWVNGYTFYFELARNLAAGHGYSSVAGEPTAFRVPLYPMFLAAVTHGERTFLTLVSAQALIGTATVVLGASIAAELFGTTSALLAASALAVYPYYVVHDTALQETSLFTALTALSVLLLLRARRTTRVAHALFAGLALAAAVLTRSTLLPFACLAPLWLFAAARVRTRVRVACALACAAALALGVAPWLTYSHAVVGAPVFGTEAGYMLWRGHNPHTFSRYPTQSMDLSAQLAHAALPADTVAALERLSDDELGLDRFYLRRGLDFIADDPARALAGAGRKLAAAFGVLPSPRHAPFENFVHALSYGPIALLALLGLVMATERERARERTLLYALLLWFALTTAVFFGHTSHRAVIDVYLIVFATVPVTRALRRLPQRSATPGS